MASGQARGSSQASVMTLARRRTPARCDRCNPNRTDLRSRQGPGSREASEHCIACSGAPNRCRCGKLSIRVPQLIEQGQGASGSVVGHRPSALGAFQQVARVRAKRRSLVGLMRSLARVYPAAGQASAEHGPGSPPRQTQGPARNQRETSRRLTLTPLELIDHLAALIPPPRRHRDRSHGRAPAERAPACSGRRVWA
jgi:hypothetical protein